MIRYRAGYKYQLAEDYTVRTPVCPDDDIIHDWFVLTRIGVLLIKSGYAWDGASGPTFDTKSSMRPSLVHDVFCQMMRTELLSFNKWQNAVNDFFREHCISKGMNWFRARYWYMAVEFAEAGRPDGEDPNPVIEAP